MHEKILTLAALLSACALLPLSPPGEAQPRELRPVQLNVFVADAGVVVARARGLFAAEGLEVPITVTRSSTDQMRGISAGTYAVAQTAFDNVLAWSAREGAEIVAVAQPTDTSILPLFVRPEIRDFSDLRGRKLAVDARWIPHLR